MDPKNKAVLERINSIEEALTKAREYLATGAHADWHGFRPLLTPKIKDGRKVPPHEDWVKNVFVPNHQKAMREAEKKLDRLNQKP